MARINPFRRLQPYWYGFGCTLHAAHLVEGVHLVSSIRWLILVFDGERRTADTFGAFLERRSVSKSQHVPDRDEEDVL